VAIQQMWKQALNINISLYNQDWKVYLDSMRTMNYQMARAAWIGDYIDPNTFLDMFVTDGGNNRTGWSNAEYDDLIARAAGETDQQQRFALFQRAEAILMDEVPIIPIYTYARIFLKSPDVKGWYPNIMDYHPYKYVYLEASTPN
jgi:oligopeptide transport system substrate-binding protein